MRDRGRSGLRLALKIDGPDRDLGVGGREREPRKIVSEGKIEMAKEEKRLFVREINRRPILVA